jgi:hypothetical protein
MNIKEIKLPLPPGCRRPSHMDDFGDEKTVGLYLKSRDPSVKFEFQFGIFMGENKVGLINLAGNVNQIIEYVSSKEMHDYWILD